MADNVAITAGSGTTVAADEVADGTLGTVKVQYVKLMDGTLDGTTKAAVGANGLAADVKASVLPTGAATSALQTTGNTSLSSIDGKVPALGQALAAASVPVILPSATITTLTPPAAITGFATEAGHLATIDTSTAKIPSQGQALAAASLPVVLPATQITTLTPPSNTGYALDASLTTIDTDIKSNITLHAGTNVIGHVIADTGSTTAVTQATGTNLHTVVDSGTITTVSAVTAITNALPAGTNLMGKVGIDQTTLGTTNAVTIVPSTIGGWTPKSLVALSSTKTAVKAGAGTVGGYMFYNPNAAVTYIQVWNVAIGSIIVGSTAPTYVIPIPATSGANIEFTNGINHSTEINVAATTTATNATAPSTAVDGFMLFK